MLVAENIAVLRGDRLVLSGVQLAAGPGEALVLLGRNGAGKSTLLRVLAGLRRPDSGRVSWNGADVLADPDHPRRVAYLGHQDALKPGLTAAQNLFFAAALSGGDVAAALESAGIAPLADLPVRALSAGQKRRVALARLALGGAPLWLLDEPSVGLDLASVARLAAVLAAHRARGGIVVAATHQDLPLPGAREMTL